MFYARWQKVTVTNVSATSGWQPADITIQQGQSVSISASGTWTMNTTTAGHGTYGGIGHDIIASSEYPLPGVNEGSLIGQIGSDLFYIGNSTSFIASNSGPLQLRINDQDIGLTDNEGTLTVTIKVK